MVHSDNKKLVIGNHEIELPTLIAQIIEIENLVIVRVYPSDNELNSYSQDLLNKNVYCYSFNGELIWQISEAPHGGTLEDKAYMNLWIDDGRLAAGNWNGIDYIVNIKDGKVSSLREGVRPW